MSDRQYDVMVAGHVCFDVIPRFPDTGAKTFAEIIRPGKLVQMRAATMSTGGPVSNTGLNLKTLGNRVCFCARVGDDDFGRLTLDYLERAGSAQGVHVVTGSASSYTVALAPPGIDRVFLHHPGTNDEFDPGDLQPALIRQCRHFHFGYPPLMARMFENGGEALEQVFRTAKEAGATTSCDMALPDPHSISGKAPWRVILERILPHVDIFLPSIEEVFYMLEPDRFLAMKQQHNGEELIDHLDPEDYGRLAGKLLEMGCAMTTLKSGHRGFYLKTGGQDALAAMGAAKPGHPAAWTRRELWGPACHAPNLASATGSGDSSIAGFLSAFLRGLGPEQAVRYANCVGWQNVQELDAISGVHDWDHTTALLDQDMPTNDPRLAEHGWQWSDPGRVWLGPADAARG